MAIATVTVAAMLWCSQCSFDFTITIPSNYSIPLWLRLRLSVRLRLTLGMEQAGRVEKMKKNIVYILLFLQPGPQNLLSLDKVLSTVQDIVSAALSLYLNLTPQPSSPTPNIAFALLLLKRMIFLTAITPPKPKWPPSVCTFPSVTTASPTC